VALENPPRRLGEHRARGLRERGADLVLVPLRSFLRGVRAARAGGGRQSRGQRDEGESAADDPPGRPVERDSQHGDSEGEDACPRGGPVEGRSARRRRRRHRHRPDGRRGALPQLLDPGQGVVDGVGPRGRQLALGAAGPLRADGGDGGSGRPLRLREGPTAPPGHGGADRGGDRPDAGGAQQVIDGPAEVRVAGRFRRGAHLAQEPTGDPVDRGRGRPVRGGLGRDGIRQDVAQRRHPRAAEAAGLEHGHVTEALLREQPPDVGHDRSTPVRIERVHLVQHHHHGIGTCSQVGQVELVQDVVGVLLRVDDPDEDIDHGEEPIDLLGVVFLHRVVVRQVEEDQPVERPLPLPLQEGVEEHAALDAEEVEELVRPNTPRAGAGAPGRRPGRTRIREAGAREGVEQRGLPGTGPTHQGDDGVAPRPPVPGLRLLELPQRLRPRGQFRSGLCDRLPHPREGLGDIRSHRGAP